MKKRIATAGICFLLAVTAFTGHSHFAKADTTKSYQDEIDAAKAKKEELEQERAELEQKVEELKQQKEDMNAYIESVDRQYVELIQSIEELEADIAEQETALLETQQMLAQAKAQEAEQYETMKQRIRYLYENGETSFLEVFFGAGSLTDMLNEMEYRAAITKYDNSLLERYTATKLQVQETEALIIARLDEMNALNESRAFELAQVEELLAAKAAELEALAASIGVDEEMLMTYWDEIVTMGADIEELERKEAERIAEEERKRKEEEERLRREAEERAKRQQEASNLKNSSNLEYILWPVPKSGRVTSEYGYRTAPVSGATTFHQAIDIGVGNLARKDRTVVAALAGTVITATYSRSAGNYIVIDHGNGVTTKYLHGYELYVKVGQKVQRGEAIMEAGTTGYSSGPHLDFSIWINGVSVDPLNYVDYSDWK